MFWCKNVSIHIVRGTNDPSLGEECGGAADDVAACRQCRQCRVLDDTELGFDVGPAVRPSHVVGVGGALDIEPVRHEDRGHNPRQSLRIQNGLKS